MSTDPATAVTEGWAGEKGRFWAEHADWFSRMLADFGDAVIDGAELGEGERVLDVGCGGGDLSLAAAREVGPTGSVLGVDISADELEVARQRARDRGLSNVEFRVADAGRDDLGPDPADVLCSRFGVMFFPEPVEAFTHLRASLRPGGRLAFVCWRDVQHNAWLTVPRDAMAEVLPFPSPGEGPQLGGFAFADPDHVRGILDAAGFTGIDLTDVEREVHLGDSADDAMAFVRQMDHAKVVLDPAPPALADEAVGRAREALSAHSSVDGISLPGQAWLVRARA